MAQSPLQNLQRLQAQYTRNQQARRDQLVQLRRNIKKTMILIIVGALIVATIADILSVFDVGWLISWTIPMICWVMVRRLTNINKAGDQIAATNTAARRQLRILRQQLRPALLQTGSIRLLSGTTTEDLIWRGKSYISTFIRDTAIAQLLELIPFLDWLPFYIGQVVKLYVDQNIAYQKVKKLLPRLEHTFQQIELLEQFDMQFQVQQFTGSLRIRRTQQSRVSRQQAAPAQPRTMRDLVPIPAT